VHRAAATASKTALSISPRLQQAGPPNRPHHAGTRRLQQTLLPSLAY